VFAVRSVVRHGYPVARAREVCILSANVVLAECFLTVDELAAVIAQRAQVACQIDQGAGEVGFGGRGQARQSGTASLAVAWSCRALGLSARAVDSHPYSEGSRARLENLWRNDAPECLDPSDRDQQKPMP